MKVTLVVLLSMLAIVFLTPLAKSPLLDCSWNTNTGRQDDTSVSADEAIVAEIESILQQQSVAWNHSDIPGFMEAYWKSPRLTFSSGGQTTRGWEATCKRYQTKYDTPEKMGQLTFGNLETSLLNPNAALVLGTWKLALDDQSNPGGNFSLVFQKIQERWVIVHDHTSVQTAE